MTKSPRQSTIALLTVSLFVQPGASAASVEDIVIKYGLTGTWAADCAKPPSPQNPHLFYRLLGSDRLERETLIAPGKSFDMSVVHSIVEASPGELVMAWKTGEGGITNRVRASLGEMQVVDSTRDSGEKLFVNGRRVRDDALASKFKKCPEGRRAALRAG